MNAKKILISVVIIESLFLGGCVATPYYGNPGYFGSTVYGNRFPPYYGNYSYMRTYSRQPIFSGHIHLDGGHRHYIGGHRHHGHKHFGGSHWRGGHRGHRW